MKIGVPTEIKNHEYRVGLVPASVKELKGRGHEVSVQSGAGLGVGMNDEHYRGAGAQILADASDVFEASEMIVKVKEPRLLNAPCCERVRPCLPICTWHPTPSRPKTL